MAHFASVKKQEMIELGRRKEGMPEIVFEYTKNTKDSLPDSKISDFIDAFVKQAQEEKVQTEKVTFEVKSSNRLAFDYLRAHLKEGSITDLILKYEGDTYDAVMPNGKMINDCVPDSFDPYCDFLMELL